MDETWKLGDGYTIQLQAGGITAFGESHQTLRFPADNVPTDLQNKIRRAVESQLEKALSCSSPHVEVRLDTILARGL